MKIKIHISYLCISARAVLRENFVVINTYIKKEERSHINNLTLYFKEIEEEQT